MRLALCRVVSDVAVSSAHHESIALIMRYRTRTAVDKLQTEKFDHSDSLPLNVNARHDEDDMPTIHMALFVIVLNIHRSL